jgi:hypothetical protein
MQIQHERSHKIAVRLTIRCTFFPHMQSEECSGNTLMSEQHYFDIPSFHVPPSFGCVRIQWSDVMLGCIHMQLTTTFCRILFQAAMVARCLLLPIPVKKIMCKSACN